MVQIRLRKIICHGGGRSLRCDQIPVPTLAPFRQRPTELCAWRYSAPRRRAQRAQLPCERALRDVDRDARVGERKVPPSTTPYGAYVVRNALKNGAVKSTTLRMYANGKLSGALACTKMRPR